jgi:hypothetical protein
MGGIMNILSFDNNDGVGVCGTSLMGKVRTTYDNLVDAFGEPTYDASHSGDGKVCVEWTLEFIVEIEDQYEIYEDCITATVYAWKEASIPYGEYDWHIGGHDFGAVECVETALATRAGVHA